MYAMFSLLIGMIVTDVSSINREDSDRHMIKFGFFLKNDEFSHNQAKSL